MNYNSQTIPGADYSKPLREMLPEIIGKRSKSAPKIAAVAGRRPQSVTDLLNRLHAKGEVHIKRWTRGASGPYIACFLWGPGKDAKRPAPISDAEKSRRYRNTENGKKVCKACRDRWHATEQGKDYVESYNKARWAREKFSKGGLAAIDPLLAAVMGRRNQPTEEQSCI